MIRRWRAVTLLLCGGGIVLLSPAARATVEMQKEARELGFEVKNCLHCHARAHAVKKMKQKARELNMADGNCLLCHGTEIPARLNDRGQWLVDEKARRDAPGFDMSWLRDYVAPETEPDEKPEPGKE